MTTPSRPVNGGPVAPKVLEAKGRARYLWLLGWLGGGLVFIVPTALWDYRGVESLASFLSSTSYIGAVALISGSIAVRGFRRGISADSTGVTVVNFFRRVVIPWHQLRGIGFERVDSEAVEGMYHKLVFTCADRTVTAQAPGSGAQPGEYLYELRETLLAMRAANAVRD